MKFFAVTSILAALAAVAVAAPAPEAAPVAVSVSFDTVYDNPNGDLHTVTCSDGSNGLLTKGKDKSTSLTSHPCRSQSPRT
jgi:hypothetical protein